MAHYGNVGIADAYRERYVAYLDLLGFKSLVARADQDPEIRSMLREVLKLVQDSLCETPSTGMRFTFFSDCIVLSAHRTEQGLWEMFNSIECLTTNLLQYDVLVRGGLAAGGAHHDRDFLFGIAVNRAYLLESQCAKYPITLVSHEVMEDAKAFGQHHMEWLIEDSPQRFFVDYLRRYAEYRHEPIFQGKTVLDDPAGRIIDFICQRLNRDKDTILTKAEWMRGYWNQRVAVYGVFGSIEAGVTDHYKSYGPTIIVRRMVAMDNKVDLNALEVLMKKLKKRLPSIFDDELTVVKFSAVIRDDPEKFDQVRRAYDGADGLTEEDLNMLVVDILSEA